VVGAGVGYATARGTLGSSYCKRRRVSRRERAPITADAWKRIDDEACRVLKLHVAGRKLVDFFGAAWLRVPGSREEPLEEPFERFYFPSCRAASSSIEWASFTSRAVIPPESWVARSMRTVFQTLNHSG